MKKLDITPEKVMRNEELMSLRGGYDFTTGTCGAFVPSGNSSQSGGTSSTFPADTAIITDDGIT